MHFFNGHGWGMGWGWIIGLVLLVVLILFIVKLANQSNRMPRSPEKSPLDILKERYARGEIDKEEFEQREKDLS